MHQSLLLQPHASCRACNRWHYTTPPTPNEMGTLNRGRGEERECLCSCGSRGSSLFIMSKWKMKSTLGLGPRKICDNPPPLPTLGAMDLVIAKEYCLNHVFMQANANRRQLHCGSFLNASQVAADQTQITLCSQENGVRTIILNYPKKRLFLVRHFLLKCNAP